MHYDTHCGTIYTVSIQWRWINFDGDMSLTSYIDHESWLLLRDLQNLVSTWKPLSHRMNQVPCSAVQLGTAWSICSVHTPQHRSAEAKGSHSCGVWALGGATEQQMDHTWHMAIVSGATPWNSDTYAYGNIGSPKAPEPRICSRMIRGLSCS